MDYRIFHAINSFAGQFDAIDDVFELLSRYGPVLLVALCFGMWFWPGDRPERADRQWACIAAAGSALLALGLNQLILLFWQRPRPFIDHSVVLLLKPSHDPSFPSDHATFVFAVAVAIWLANRRIGWVALGLATLVAFSRVYVGEHYVSDVLAGAAIGAVAAIAVSQLRPLVLPVLEPAFRVARRVHLA